MCGSSGKTKSTSVFWPCVATVYPIAVAWGFGTALGELPPYFIARSARLVGTESEYEQELEDAKKEAEDGKGVGAAFAKMKLWTVNFTQKFGLMGVVALSAWPNAAFDMCGMACGYLNMPFFSFLGGLVVGKAFIKVGMQAIFFCGLFGPGFFDIVVTIVRSVSEYVPMLKKAKIAATMKAKRSELMLKFKREKRILPPKGGLDRKALETLYKDEKDAGKVVSRVMKGWDANKDGKLSVEEISGAIWQKERSLASPFGGDGMMSRSSLDPAAEA